jgi:hypothetical protein
MKGIAPSAPPSGTKGGPRPALSGRLPRDASAQFETSRCEVVYIVALLDVYGRSPLSLGVRRVALRRLNID